MTSDPGSRQGYRLRKLASVWWWGTRSVYRHMPSAKRCKVCWIPFKGPFSMPFKIMQLRPSRKNPNMCTS